MKIKIVKIVKIVKIQAYFSTEKIPIIADKMNNFDSEEINKMYKKLKLH